MLETARLILRPPRAEDFEPWAAFMADEEAARHLGGPASRPLAWRSFLTMTGAWPIQGFSLFSVIEKTTGQWLGRIGPWAPEGWPGTEIAWGLARAAWGEGYATEAASATIDWAFDQLGWHEIIHTIAPDNVASQAVARRLGSSLRGPRRLPEPFVESPIEIWGQTRAQWRGR